MRTPKTTTRNAAMRTFSIRGMLVVLTAATWVCAGPGLWAQSGAASGQSGQSPTPATSSDNPFAGGAPQATTPQSAGAGQGDGAKPGAAHKKESDNPFPGEDPDAPIIPVEPGGNDGKPAPRPAGDQGSNPAGQRDTSGDPVRSPDETGHPSEAAADPVGDDGFSSSTSGMNAAPGAGGADPEAADAKAPVPVEDVKEDVNVGQFYLERKNWRAARFRFAAAFAAEKENPEAVWGLAEAERHLGMLKEADEHYKLFLSYDPTGPHGKAARKALGEVEAEMKSPGMHENNRN